MQKTFRFPGIKLGEFSVLPESEISSTVQILRTGSFFHPEYGNLIITDSQLEQMINNFSEKVRGVDLAIDYSHEAEKEAAGWIEELYLQDSQDGKKELWARVKWTPTGKQNLIDRKYRYLSADFTFNYIHNESLKEFGPTLFGAGLTNRPVIKDMAPVIELSEGEAKMDEKDKMIEALKAQVADLMKQKEGYDAEMGAMKAKLGEYEVAAKKSDEDKVAAEAKLAEMKKTEEFNTLLSEGKACEAQRTHFMSGDAMAYAKAAQPVKLSEVGSNQKPVEKSSDDIEDRILTEAKKLCESNKKLDLDLAIRKVLSENSELKKLYDLKRKGE